MHRDTAAHRNRSWYMEQVMVGWSKPKQAVAAADQRVAQRPARRGPVVQSL
jgi:hypothetical protein